MAALIRSASLTNYAEIARKVGLDPARMLAGCRLPAKCLHDAELKIPLDAARTLLETSAERSGVEAFGLLMAETRRLSNLGPVGLLVREQPTLRLGIDALMRHSRKLNAALFLTIEESGDVVVLREELIVGDGGSVRQSTELAIGVAFRMLRTFLGPLWKPRRVCFAHDPPRDRSVHERIFGRNVEFGHDFNGIVCDRRDLEAPNPDADPDMARYAGQLIAADTPVDIVAQVRELVVTLLASGRCTIEIVAQHLGIDRRTVHRRLAGAGDTFSGIVDAVRRELAERYVGNGVRSLAEISSLLGFAAPSGFTRWYRKQFDRPPSRRRTRPRSSGRRAGR